MSDGKLIGELKGLADYLEPNDVSASTLIRRASAALTARQAEIDELVEAGRCEGLEQAAKVSESHCGGENDEWSDPFDHGFTAGVDAAGERIAAAIRSLAKHEGKAA